MSEVKIDLNNLDKSNWKTYRFDEIAKNISERVDPNNTDLKVYIGLEHIDSESLHIKRHGTPDDVNGQKLKFYKGDIIFGRRRAYQRKAGIATWDGFCSAHALVLRANPDVIDPELFPFFLHSDLFMNRAIDISVGSLSPTINWGTLKHQEFVLPPYEEQKNFAKLLSASSLLLEKQLELVYSLKVFKKSALKESFDKANCDKVKISDISESLDNKRVPIKKGDRKKGPYPYYGASGIVDHVEDYIFDEPILLISEDGENLNSRKLPIAYEVDEKCWVNNHSHVIKITNACRYLVAEYFNFHDISDYITGGTRPKITKGMLSDMPIYLPKEHLLEKVKHKLRSTDCSIFKAKDNSDATSNLIKTITNKVF